MPSLAYPTTVGHWQIQRNSLVCHLPARTVSVRAPARLLGAVKSLCDGHAPWQEVAASLAKHWSAAPVEAFLGELASQGVLAERDAPSDAPRCGARTFSGAPVPADAMRLVLAAALHAPGRQPRWLLLALHALPAQPAGEAVQPGLYACRLTAHGRVHCARAASPRPSEAWQLLADPRSLQFASAVLLPLDDLRWDQADAGAGEAATAGLQSASQQALSLGLQCELRSDISAPALARWLPRAAGCSVPSAVLLGMPATPPQQRREHAVRWMQLRQAGGSVKDAGAPGPLAAHAFVAGPIHVGSAEVIFANGRSADPREAALKAEAEAWERLGWATLGPAVVGTAPDIEGALDPRTVVAYTVAQHRRPEFAWRPYARDRSYAWRSGVDTGTGATVRLPAECIHALGALPGRLRRGACTGTSTSGLAAWTDPQGALCRAALELVERDAFLQAWLARAPAPRIASAGLPGAARMRVQALEQAGQRVAVLQLVSPLACVLAVFVQSTTRPFTAVAAAADFEPEPALDRALHEAEARVLHAAACSAGPLASPADVRCLEDIPRLYQSPAWFRSADFLAASPAAQRFGALPPPCSGWEAFLARLAGQGRRLLAFDVTPPDASLHQGRTPLHVVRAVIPGLIPIWFQPGLEPAGLPAYRSARAAAPAGARHVPRIHPFT